MMICRRRWLVSPDRVARNRERERLLHEIDLVDHQIDLLCRKLGLSKDGARALGKEEA